MYSHHVVHLLLEGIITYNYLSSAAEPCVPPALPYLYLQRCQSLLLRQYLYSGVSFEGNSLLKLGKNTFHILSIWSIFFMLVVGHIAYSVSVSYLMAPLALEQAGTETKPFLAFASVRQLFSLFSLMFVQLPNQLKFQPISDT